MTWPHPWAALTDGAPLLVTELKREVSQQHVLFGREAIAVARRGDCDDVLFRLDDGSYAIVHLTLVRQTGPTPEVPADNNL